MAELLSVRKVESPADFKTLLEFPWAVYKGDPNWVPPMLSMQRHKYDPKQNSSWQHMEGDYFIAWRGDEPVGTIAAFVNHRYNEFNDENIGFFGAFELFDDQLIADALLDKAADALRARGVTKMRGPATFSSNEEYGILIEGFDDPPAIVTPYNHRYYQRLIENVPGVVKAMDLYGWHLTLQGAAQSEKLMRIYRVIEKNKERRGITVRPLNKKRLSDDFNMLKEIYNSAWEKNWGFVPFTDAELDELVKDLGMYVDHDLAIFAEVKGQPAGFLLGVPDMNQTLIRAYARPGKPEIITMLQALWHWKIRSKITRVRIPLMGVKEQFRGIGVEAAMFADLFERTVKVAPKKGWEYADGGWVLETNDAMNKLCEEHNGRVYKRFRVYEKTL